MMFSDKKWERFSSDKSYQVIKVKRSVGVWRCSVFESVSFYFSLISLTPNSKGVCKVFQLGNQPGSQQSNQLKVIICLKFNFQTSYFGYFIYHISIKTFD